MVAHSVSQDNTQGFICIPSRNEVNSTNFSMEFLISVQDLRIFFDKAIPALVLTRQLGFM